MSSMLPVGQRAHGDLLDPTSVEAVLGGRYVYLVQLDRDTARTYYRAFPPVSNKSERPTKPLTVCSRSWPNG